MRDRTELDIERSEIDAAARRDYGDRNFRRIALGSAFGLEQGSAEFGRINRALQPWPEVDDGAEMVFMGVGEDEADQVLALFFEELDVGHDQIDARQMLLIAKGHAETDREPGALLAASRAREWQGSREFAGRAQ